MERTGARARRKGLRLGIQGKILLSFMLLIVISLLVTNLFWYANASDIIVEQAESAASSRIEKANDSVEQVLRDLDSLSISIAFNDTYVINFFRYSIHKEGYESYSAVTSLDNYLRSLYYAKTYIACITVIDQQGNRYSMGSPVVYTDIPERPWYGDILENQRRRTIIKYDPAEYDFHSAYRENVMTIGRQIRTTGGDFLGVILLDFDYQFIKSAFAEPTTQGAITFVVNEKGQCIYDSASTGTSFTLDGGLEEIRQLVLRSGERTQRVQYQGREYLAIRYHSDYTGWDTISLLETGSLTAEVDALVNLMTLVLALSVLALILVSLLISKQITRNLKALASSMDAFGEGGALLEVPNVNDEVGDLGRGFLEMTVRVENLIRENAQKEKRKRHAEYEAMQAQIHPHFLYNALNTVKNLAEMQGATNIENVSYSIIELLRATLGNGEQMLTIAEELALIRHYLTIQEYKTTRPFTVDFRIAADCEDIRIPKLLVQPVVENALIHGLWPSGRAGEIRVEVAREGELVRIVVRDNGVGMDETEIAGVLRMHGRPQIGRLNSIGIHNVHERIKLHYGEAYGVRVRSEKGRFTEVTLEFPAG